MLVYVAIESNKQMHYCLQLYGSHFPYLLNKHGRPKHVYPYLQNGKGKNKFPVITESLEKAIVIMFCLGFHFIFELTKTVTGRACLDRPAYALYDC